MNNLIIFGLSFRSLNAIDGIYTSIFASDSSTPLNYIEFDLGVTRNVTAISFYGLKYILPLIPERFTNIEVSKT